jgi:hypothetical protein
VLCGTFSEALLACAGVFVLMLQQGDLNLSAFVQAPDKLFCCCEVGA